MIQKLRIGPKPRATPYSMMRVATLTDAGTRRKRRATRRPSETTTARTNERKYSKPRRKNRKSATTSASEPAYRGMSSRRRFSSSELGRMRCRWVARGRKNQTTTWKTTPEPLARDTEARPAAIHSAVT